MEEENTNNIQFDFDEALLLSFEDFIKFYSFKDTDEVYTNGGVLIQTFRLKQWLDYHISKNDINNNNIKISKED